MMLTYVWSNNNDNKFSVKLKLTNGSEILIHPPLNIAIFYIIQGKL